MDDSKKELIKIYPEYYQCSGNRCESIYHVSNFRFKDFVCRDCGTESIVPDEALPVKKSQPRSK